MTAARTLVSVICLLVGLVWIGQGLNLIQGSFMTGQRTWSVVGIVLVAFAVLQLALLARARKRG